MQQRGLITPLNAGDGRVYRGLEEKVGQIGLAHKGLVNTVCHFRTEALLGCHAACSLRCPLRGVPFHGSRMSSTSGSFLSRMARIAITAAIAITRYDKLKMTMDSNS